MAAAAETFSDLRGFCARRPGVCETAGKLAVTMEGKAKYSAKLIYEWANDASQGEPRRSVLPPDLAEADPIATGTMNGDMAEAGTQSTLTLSDLIPEWKAPPKPKKG